MRHNSGNSGSNKENIRRKEEKIKTKIQQTKQCMIHLSLSYRRLWHLYL